VELKKERKKAWPSVIGQDSLDNIYIMEICNYSFKIPAYFSTMLVCKGDKVHKLQAESGRKRGKFRQHHDAFACTSTKAINVVVAPFLYF
jgi:hypothetical protein